MSQPQPKAPFHFVPLPEKRSTRKPRKSGRTMIVDDGLPLAYARDLVALGGAYIDLAKIKTGTVRLYPRAQLVAKLRLYSATASSLSSAGNSTSTCSPRRAKRPCRGITASPS